jgi:hypothetical protein
VDPEYDYKKYIAIQLYHCKYNSFIFRLNGHVRCISSVVPKSDIQLKDFTVKNEPILGYLPGSKERADLEASLSKHANNVEDCPIIIGGKEYRTDQVQYQVMVSED